MVRMLDLLCGVHPVFLLRALLRFLPRPPCVVYFWDSVVWGRVVDVVELALKETHRNGEGNVRK